jgi:hypothetical protein
MKQKRIEAEPEGSTVDRLLHAIEAHVPVDLEEERASGVRKQIAFRLPPCTLAKADAFARMSGKSRNETLLALLEAGIEAVLASMPQAQLEQFTDVQNDAYNDLVG